MLLCALLVFALTFSLGPYSVIGYAVLLPVLTPITVYLAGAIRSRSLLPKLNPEMVWTVFCMMVLYVALVPAEVMLPLMAVVMLTPFVMVWTTWVAAMPCQGPAMDKGQMIACLFGPYVLYGIFVLITFATGVNLALWPVPIFD